MSEEAISQQNDQSLELAKKRAMAALAMEGDERRKQRALEEKFKKEKELLEIRKQEERVRAQGDMARKETEQLAKVKRLREERAAQALEEKEITSEVRMQPNVSLSPLRTLKVDMGRMIKDTKQSMVSMAIKEEEKQRAEQVGMVTERKKNHVLFFISAVCIMGGIGVLGWWGYTSYQAKRIATIPNAAPTVDSIIFAEGYKDIVVTDENPVTLTTKLRLAVSNNNIPIGTIQYNRFVDNQQGSLRVLTANEWLVSLNSSAPESLVRLLSDTFMYGIFSGAQNSGFVIFTTSYYEKAFAGMLGWEGTLARDLYAILAGNPVTPDLQNTRFVDVNIKNIAARALKNSNGSTALIYAFLPDKKTIVVAHNEATILQVLTRITTPKPQTQK